MKKLCFHALTAALLAAVSVANCPAAARAEESLRGAAPPVAAAPQDDEAYYRTVPPPVEKYSIAQQKAMLRGAQRMARLDSMRWYGFSGSRPTATAIAFTSMYSPAWEQPGGRPFAWYMGSRPVIVYTGQSLLYR